jgi:hypothetical protein
VTHGIELLEVCVIPALVTQAKLLPPDWLTEIHWALPRSKKWNVPCPRIANHRWTCPPPPLALLAAFRMHAPMPIRQLGGHVLVGLYEWVTGCSFPAIQCEWVPMSYKGEEKIAQVASHVLEMKPSLSTSSWTTTGPNKQCNG